MPECTDGEWDERVTAARRALDDTTLVVEIARTALRVAASVAPTIEVIAGAEALTRSARLGFISGSFNPMTKAHAALGRAAMASGEIDALVWSCAAATIDKENVARATLTDRLVQLQSYAGYQPGSAVALVNRGLYVDQAELIGGLSAAGAEVAVIVGFDKAVQIFDPRYYEDRGAALAQLFTVARLLVAPRNDDDQEGLGTLLRRPQNAMYAAQVGYLDVPSDVRTESSTQARRLAALRDGDSALTELLDLLTPEGFAVATMSDVYAADEKDDADAYLWRSRWVERLAHAVLETTAPVAALRDLVAASMRKDEVGARIRELLKESAVSPELVADAVKLAGSAR